MVSEEARISTKPRRMKKQIKDEKKTNIFLHAKFHDINKYYYTVLHLSRIFINHHIKFLNSSRITKYITINTPDINTLPTWLSRCNETLEPKTRCDEISCEFNHLSKSTRLPNILLITGANDTSFNCSCTFRS